MSFDARESRFWQAAVRSGLIDAGGLEACLAAIPPERRVPEAIDRRLARQAVDGGRLTLWQAQQLLLDRWQGLRIDKYALLDILGDGGMGRVYLAQDTRLDRRVAIKVLSRRRRGVPRALARFDREARIGGQLQNEHLIRVYDAGDVFGLRFLVMEYIDGKTVARLLEDQGRLPPDVAAEVARQAALGLEHLDQKGLVHRDINPSNILVDRGGVTKLTDLGLAVDMNDLGELTREGATVGTFDYIAPEQVHNSHAVDIRTDIYSLGCTLFQMVAGRAPFQGATPTEKLVAHQMADPGPLASAAPGCPPGLDAVVRRMMHKTPSGRFARASEVAEALAEFASGPAALSRIVRSEGSTESPPTGAAPEAYAAEWRDADADGASAPGPLATDSTDIFHKTELDPGPPEPASHPADGPRDGPGLSPILWAVALLIAAQLTLAIGLALSWW